VFACFYISKDLFAPAKIKNENLIGLGLTGKHAGPSFNVLISEKEKPEIAINLHYLNHTISRVNADKIIKGQRQFLIRPFIMRGRADWCHNIVKLEEPQLINYDDWNNTILANTNWIHRNNKNIMLKCSKCNKLDPFIDLKPLIFDVDKNIKCKHCSKQSASKYWTCPCDISWFTCVKHKWYACDGPSTKNTKEESNRPKKCAKNNNDEEGIQPQERPNKIPKKQHGATIAGESDPNLMVSHQQMLLDEIKNEKEKCQHTAQEKRKNDVTLDDSGVAAKRPSVLGLSLSARFGIPIYKLANKDANYKANQHPGEMVRKREGENHPNLTKKPRCDGEFHPNEHGVPPNPASSSSDAL